MIFLVDGLLDLAWLPRETPLPRPIDERELAPTVALRNPFEPLFFDRVDLRRKPASVVVTRLSSATFTTFVLK